MELDVKGTGLLRFLVDRGPGKGGGSMQFKHFR